MRLNLSDQEIELVERLASTFFTPERICQALECDLEDFKTELKNKSSEVTKAFNTGKLNAEIELWENIKRQANNGSVPAQQMLEKRHNDLKMEMQKLELDG